jgi:CHASE2 domain-containing sensor protein/two-component sensor histidine kinase
VGTGLVIGARMLGLLQPLEWAALDVMLRWRSPEPMDERVVIVAVTEADIQAVGVYPLPDEVLAQLLNQLQTDDPQIIGLDIVRDLPVEPGHEELMAAFQSMENLVGAETVVPDRADALINPPPTLPPEQVGFVDNILDGDGNVRRSLLGSPTPDGGYQFSMPVRLTMAYLNAYGIQAANGLRDPEAMRFEAVELPRFHPNSGGYVRADDGGLQTLLNFRRGSVPFRKVSLMEVLEGRVESAWFRDRIVLIGVTASRAQDTSQTSAVTSSNPGLVFGVELLAHATSQLVSAVLDDRPLLRTWADGWEYSWIILWGGVGIVASRLIQRPGRYSGVIVLISLGLIGLGYGSIYAGWWLPIVPAVLAFWLNGVVFHVVYLYNRSLQSRIRDRQMVIEQAFTTIHNGPLQTLATLIHHSDDPDVPRAQLQQELQHLNRELRSVRDTMRQEVVQGDQIYLQGKTELHLSSPLHSLLYEIYNDTLRRDFPHFAPIKALIVKFEPFDERGLSLEQKRDLCRFLEEALCNVGKHAVGAKRLVIDCRYINGFNVIRVVDNGVGLEPTVKPVADSASGRGTQQATVLARWLGGTFERSPNTPKGTICELRWRPTPSWLHTQFRQLQHGITALRA